MVAAAFTSPKALQEWGGRRTRFLRCNLSHAVFRGVEFRASLFEECEFDGALFSGCDLRGARFVGSKPTFADCIQ